MKFGIFLEYLFLVPLHAINTGAIFLKILETGKSWCSCYIVLSCA